MAETVLRRIIFSLYLIAFCFTVHAAENQSPLNRPFNREILENYRSKSDEYVARNLNRFALDRMYVYDKLLDSLYQKEKTDTLAYIETSYNANSAERISSIASLKKEISVQTQVKTALEDRYWSLVKYAVLAFVVWLGIVFVFIKIRQRRVKKAAVNFDSSATQLESMEDLSGKAEKLFSDFTDKKEQILKLDAEILKLENLASTVKDKAETNGDLKTFITRTEKLRKAIDAEKRIVDSVLSQSASHNEKTTVDINAICDAYMEIAFRGISKSDEFECQVSRDFEKKLPGLQMNPSAVGTLLLNVLSNAFESVKEKNELGIKGYQPKVSISTRILPKYLQVRIKDNGTGMNDELLQSAGKEFFTTRTLNPRPGLGLSIAKAIIEEHKGEIKIESEEGNSTDVYLKFYLK